MKGRRREIFGRVYQRVVKVHGPMLSPCWIWQGSDSGNGRGGGYGRMSLDNATHAVHRVMYVLWCGPIAYGKQIDHLCKNRKCCNPLHLEQVTHLKNQKRKRT